MAMNYSGLTISSTTRLHSGFTSGFTLIEMLVSITIMLLMVGGGIAAFVTFNEQQVVLGAAKELQGTVRAAQQRAQAATKPSDTCDKLQSYAVRAPQSPPIEIVVVAECDSGDTTVSTVSLADSIALSAPLDMSFKVLKGGVINSGDITVTSVTTGQSYTFSVTAGGEITQGEFDQ
jgi:prepilin-type N-terminal cleavage/methylation domain-containing protein